ncbi:hypothetical protein [Novacetimonas maltaceti]|uniref:hypothetical protein n=1 Tax=Novacetimonas maltaceti TaxID=1203393 RepID=UPI0011AF5AFD|nr:hypothetical protein [Novacetimonas maltaceti]
MKYHRGECSVSRAPMRAAMPGAMVAGVDLDGRWRAMRDGATMVSRRHGGYGHGDAARRAAGMAA